MFYSFCLNDPVLEKKYFFYGFFLESCYRNCEKKIISFWIKAGIGGRARQHSEEENNSFTLLGNKSREKNYSTVPLSSFLAPWMEQSISVGCVCDIVCMWVTWVSVCGWQESQTASQSVMESRNLDTMLQGTFFGHFSIIHTWISSMIGNLVFYVCYIRINKKIHW